jgi:hypothetical protein
VESLFKSPSRLFPYILDKRRSVRPQRLPQNNCSAHSLAVFSWNSRIGQDAFRDFAEHIRFSEFFGTDDDIGSRRRINQESRERRKRSGENLESRKPGNGGIALISWIHGFQIRIFPVFLLS